MQPLPSLTACVSWILPRDPGERRSQNRGEKGLYPYTSGADESQRTQTRQRHRQGERESMGGLGSEVHNGRKGLEWHQWGLGGCHWISIVWSCW